MKKQFEILCLFILLVSCKNNEELTYTEYNNIQEIEAVDTIELTKIDDGKFYSPKFTASGNKAVFTTENYTGLWYYNFETKIINQLNPSVGAGINFDVSKKDEKVYFKLQSTSAKGDVKNYSIAEQDIDTKAIDILYTNRSYISEPKALIDGNVAFLSNDEIKILNIETKKFIDNYNAEELIVFADGNTLKIKMSNNDKEVIPEEEGQVVWVDVSSGNDKIYFYSTAKGTGVYVIESNEIKWLGDLRYLRNSPQSNLVVYSFYENGSENYDLFISIGGDLNKFNITHSSTDNETFPCWSSDGSKIIYNTARGVIKLSTLKIIKGSNV